MSNSIISKVNIFLLLHKSSYLRCFLFAVNFNDSEFVNESIDDGFPSLTKVLMEDKVKDPLEDVEPNTTGTFLPGDEDELFAGLMDDFDLSGLPTQLEDLDDDFFVSGGGLEIDSESHDSIVNGISRLSMSDGINGNTISHYGLTNGVGTVSGEHPYGEHPSRTLFVRNINSNVEDSELRSLFEVLLLPLSRFLACASAYNLSETDATISQLCLHLSM